MVVVRDKTQLIPYTDEMRALVTELSEQTGWGNVAVRKRIIELKLEGWEYATYGRVFTIFYNKEVKSVRRDIYNSVLEVLKNISPDLLKTNNNERVRVDPSLAQQAVDIVAASQLSYARAMKLAGAPDDLDIESIRRISDGRQKSLKKSHFEFLVKFLEDGIEDTKNLTDESSKLHIGYLDPNSRIYGRVTFDDEFQKKLKAFFKASKFTTRRTLMRYEAPHDLKPKMIHQAYAGKIKSLKPSHYQFLKELIDEVIQ